MVALLRKAWNILTVIRNGLANFIFIIIIIVIAAAIFSGGRPPLPDNAPLYISMSGRLVDQITYQPNLLDIMQENIDNQEILLRDVTTAIRHATTDARITALVLDMNGLMGGGLSKLEEIGQAIDHFKTSGKPVIAFADHFSQSQYFLAAYADSIYLNTMGNVALTGFAYYGSYFKEAADKLAVKFHLFKVGDYKDAAEPFVRNSMSDASREHNASWVNELWGRYTSIIEEKRGLPSGAIKTYIETTPNTLAESSQTFSSLAVEAGLIDGELSRVALHAMLKERFGTSRDTDYLNTIGLKRYISEITPSMPSINTSIGLITATGNIIDGEAPESQIGGDTLASLIKTARDDDTLAALIIRVDSGGGSAFASEVIREQIEKTRAEGLPVYISMGSVAASGGYWIATAANEIWATPSTLTGSIGVWGLVPNISESLTRLGIHNDGFGTTPLSDLYNIDRPLSDEAKLVFQNGVDIIYRRFISLVSEAREQAPEAIHDIAQGRVWTGAQAFELGLVDKLGSLDALTRYVREQHGIENTHYKVIRRELSPSEQFMRALAEETASVGSHLRQAIIGKELTAFTQALPKQSEIFTASDNSLQVYATCLACVAP